MTDPAPAADDGGLREALMEIGWRARSDGSRTMSELMRDMGWIDDHCRSFLSRPAAAPPAPVGDVGGLVERLQKRAEWNNSIGDILCGEAAAALMALSARVDAAETLSDYYVAAVKFQSDRAEALSARVEELEQRLLERDLTQQCALLAVEQEKREAAEARAEALSAERDGLTQKLKDEETSFNIRWKSDMRAKDRWQKETGETLTWPDHTGLSVWLMQKLVAAEARAEAERNTLKNAGINLLDRAETAEADAATMREALETIADFAVGNGDVCEIIAKRARAALSARSVTARLPEQRCDECDNGVEKEWPFCAWCGTARSVTQKNPPPEERA